MPIFFLTLRNELSIPMGIFFDNAKQEEWDYLVDDFAYMVGNKYETEILTSEQESRKRIAVDWEDLSIDMQCFLQNLSGDELIQCVAEMEGMLALDTEAKLRLGVKNYPNTIDIDRCSQNDFAGKLVQVEGMIGGMSVPLSYTSKIVWKCTECEDFNEINYEFYDRAREKNYCPKCRSITYHEQASETKTDFQIMEVVRPVSIAGRSPESLRVIVKSDLVEFGDIGENKLLSGNRVKVFGINRDFPAYKDSVRRKPYIDAMTWFVEKEYLKLTEEDIARIKKLSKHKNLLPTFVASVAPSVIGYDDIKLALLLQTVGGVSRVKEDKTLKRGTLHILLVGDPASSKTTLGMWIAKHITKSRYAVASAMTQAGLGASLSRDEKLGFWYINAGVLLLANNSIAVIDEADKAGGDDLNQLDMVMENEMLTLTKIKAGDFPARTSILALANPKQGRFDTYISYSEQVKMESQTLSRFDLKFALPDIVNDAKDEAIIKSKFKKMMPTIASELLVKYLYYAKMLEPKLSNGCQKYVIDFYKELRNRTAGQGGAVAITPRQSDTIIRLSEAFAKLRLSERVEKKDVENATIIMNSYLKTFGFDASTGSIDIDLAEGRSAKSKRDLIFRVLDIIKEKSIHGEASEEVIVSGCESQGIEREFVLRTAIPELLKNGDIYSPHLKMWAAIKG